MRDDQIIIKPFEFLEMLHFSMIKKENEHTVASFSVRIPEMSEGQYIDMALNGIEAEISVLQSMDEGDLEDVMKEAKKNDFARAGAFLQEASTTISELQNLGIKGIDDVIDGINLMVGIQSLAVSNAAPKQTGVPQEKNISPMDVLGALPIHHMLKEKGIKKTLGVLTAMKSAGIFNALAEKSAADVAGSSTAVDTVRKEATLLKGIVTELSVKNENGVKILSGTIKSGSCLMDVTPHIRSWQESSITYEDIFSTILESYKDPGCIMSEENTPIETFVLQYKETDWEFAKRMASHIHMYIVADDLTGGVKFYYGMPEPRTEEPLDLITNSYSFQKRLTEYLSKRDSKVPEILEKDAIYYQVCIRDIYYVGDKVTLNGEVLYISCIESNLRGSELYHTYICKTKAGFKLARVFNKKAIGASLSGVIAEVSKDVVKITIDDDENADGCKTRWFPYSTVYSTEDGTGWYCMPEPGDAIRLYLASDDEREAYVISSVHLITDNGEERSTPDNKSIMNIYGKEILLTPGTLIFTNNNGMSISIIDDEGIEIISDKKISITSGQSINIQSAEDEIIVNAPNSITLVQGGTKVVLKDNIIIEGAQTNVQ